MKTLIIHPQDPTTRFLWGIYDTIPNKTVITGNITKDQLRKKIDEHDRILMMGHGSPAGLFSVGQFPDAYPYIIDDTMVESLRNKDCIFIWCHADQFVLRNRITGFYTGMFISEASEAIWYDFDDIYDLDILIEQSNYGFAEIVSKYINEPLDVLYQNVMKEYGLLSEANQIALFNFKRIGMSQPEPVLFSDHVGQIL